jgi:hypothetical protein
MTIHNRLEPHQDPGLYSYCYGKITFERDDNGQTVTRRFRPFFIREDEDYIGIVDEAQERAYPDDLPGGWIPVEDHIREVEANGITPPEWNPEQHRTQPTQTTD